MTRLQALAIHTEQIHDDLVWERLKRVLVMLEHKGSRATLFVFPHRAVVAGRSDKALKRIEKAFQQGHEIAQHTHFYKGNQVDKPSKVTDLSYENVLYCLVRDHQWLSRVARPRGFTSGGWAVPSGMHTVLMELRFDYDCSARRAGLPAVRSISQMWLNEPQMLQQNGSRLLIIPTTHSLRQAIFHVRGGDLPAGAGGGLYRLVYFHDYDLKRWEVYLAVFALIILGRSWITCGELADFIGGRVSKP